MPLAEIPGALFAIVILVVIVFVLITGAIIAKFFKTWLRARLAKAPVSMANMLGMWLRKVPYPLVVDSRITAGKAGLRLLHLFLADILA